MQFMASEQWGGAEKVFVDLANELGRKHQVIALLLRDTVYISRFSAHVNIVKLKSHPTRRNPFLSYEIYKVLKNIRPDIVHTHADKGTELVAGVNKFLGLKHVGTKHNVRKGRIFNRLPWVTAVSASSKETIKTKGKARIEVIHNGLTPVEVENVSKYEIFTLLAVGRLDKLKGFDHLLRQLDRLSFDWKLLIAGIGPELGSLTELVSELKLDNSVNFLGLREDIPQLMKTVDAVVISSHAEGFCQVAIEALYYADVLVSTPVGICQELLPDMFLAEHGQLAAKIEDVHNRYDDYQCQFEELHEKRSYDFLFQNISNQYYKLYLKICD